MSCITAFASPFCVTTYVEEILSRLWIFWKSLVLKKLVDGLDFSVRLNACKLLMNERHKMAYTSRLLIFVSILIAPCLAIADFTGKCVGVSDGDIISVIKDGKAVNVRLEGVDCPEPQQDYGTKARQFTSDMVLDKEVAVRENEQDRYGRTYCRVTVSGRDLNLELVKAGMAWHYKAYSKEKALADAEAEARQAKIGLWSMPNPTPPWDFRKGKDFGDAVAAEAIEPRGETLGDLTVYVTKEGKEYHRQDCAALKEGKTPMKLSEAHENYEPCKICTPPAMPIENNDDLLIK